MLRSCLFRAIQTAGPRENLQAEPLSDTPAGGRLAVQHARQALFVKLMPYYLGCDSAQNLDRGTSHCSEHERHTIQTVEDGGLYFKTIILLSRSVLLLQQLPPLK